MQWIFTCVCTRHSPWRYFCHKLNRIAMLLSAKTKGMVSKKFRIISSQKLYDLYGQTDMQTGKIELLSLWMVECWLLQYLTQDSCPVETQGFSPYNQGSFHARWTDCSLDNRIPHRPHSLSFDHNRRLRQKKCCFVNFLSIALQKK